MREGEFGVLKKGSDGAWKKKNGSLFDVAMGSFDGAKICELVGLFLFNNLTQLVGSNNIGLYRDDGLAILKNASGPSSERIKKRIINFFQHHGLKRTAETNLVQTNFLDVTLDQRWGRYWPFRKPNDQPLYIHRLSKHPPVIKKQLPLMLATRLSQLATARNFPMQSRSTKRLCIEADTLVSWSMQITLTPRKRRRGNVTSRGLTHRLASMSKLISARNSCNCLLNTFLSITYCTRSATNSTSK